VNARPVILIRPYQGEKNKNRNRFDTCIFSVSEVPSTTFCFALEVFLDENAIEEKAESPEKPEKMGFFLVVSLFFGPKSMFSKRKTKKTLQKNPFFTDSNTSSLFDKRNHRRRLSFHPPRWNTCHKTIRVSMNCFRMRKMISSPEDQPMNHHASELASFAPGKPP
jgi:hypothetical protein